MRADASFTKEIHQGREAFALKNSNGNTSVWVRVPPSPRRSVFCAVRHAIANLRERVIYLMSAEPARRKMDAASLVRSNDALQDANKGLRRQLGTKLADESTRPAKLDANGQPIVLTLAEKNKELQDANFVLRKGVQAQAQLIEAVNVAVNDRATQGAELAEKAQAIFQTLEVLNAGRQKPDSEIAGLHLRRMHAYISSKQGDQPTLTQQQLGDLEAAVDSCKSQNNLSTGAMSVLDNIRFCARAELLRRDASAGLDKLDQDQLKLIAEDACKLWNDAHQRAPQLRSTDEIEGTAFKVNQLQTLIDDVADRQTVLRAKGIILKVGSEGFNNPSPQENQDLQSAIALCQRRRVLFTDLQVKALNQLSDRLNLKPKAVASLMPLQPIENVMPAKRPEVKPEARQGAVAQSARVPTAQVTAVKLNRAALLKVEQQKVQAEFQKMLSDAMRFLWDPSPQFADELDDFNHAAAAGFVDAVKMFQKAMAVPGLQLTDYEQSKWTGELVGSTSPEALRGIQARLNDGLLDDLLDRIASMKGVPMGTHEFVQHWAHVVSEANPEST